MPEISRFYGLVVKMYYNDHNPPHFPVRYGEAEGIFGIDSLTLLGGNLPPRARRLALEWAALHQNELQERWQQVCNYLPPDPIEPLP